MARIAPCSMLSRTLRAAIAVTVHLIAYSSRDNACLTPFLSERLRPSQIECTVTVIQAQLEESARLTDEFGQLLFEF
jgi:hypothetical protein